MGYDREYVLGTHDDEISRLALQHRVWRPRALDAWRRAGFTVGQTLLDIGCGPGHAAVDLAEIVGPSGRILAVDQSRRFLDALEATCRLRGLANITSLELDLDAAELPPVGADGAWARWVFAFVKRPRDLLARVGAALKPGGVLVVHEYFDYSTWRVAPRSPEIEEFVRVVMESWRANGGEPDIGLDMPLAGGAGLRGPDAPPHHRCRSGIQLCLAVAGGIHSGRPPAAGRFGPSDRGARPGNRGGARGE